MSTADMFRLDGRTAFVTGGSSGLGRHFALTLARAGANVALAARRTDRLETIAAQIRDEGGKALTVELDVTDSAAVKAAFDAAEAEFGTATIVVNAAGVSVGAFALDMDLAQWREVMNVNLDSIFLISSEAARRMRDAKQPGSIINIASILGETVMKTLTAYATSKA
ncbi:MAG: SDR family NAD(P)-dependent oxidoreductase, partial [Hyphomicrobiales bacterium]